MKTILLKLTSDLMPCQGTYKNDWGLKRAFDSFKVKRFSGQRVYLSVMKDGMNMTELSKKMEFRNGDVFVSFGRSKVKVGEYE